MRMFLFCLIFCLAFTVSSSLIMAATATETEQIPFSIIDDAGQRITLSGPARRIIPLYAALGETLAAMGTGDRVAGRTAADDNRDYSSVPSIGTHMRPNLEIITALHPDLIIQMEGREEAAITANALTTIGIPVARFRVTDFNGLFFCIQRLGILTGEQDAATLLVNSYTARLAAVTQRTASISQKPSIFFEVRYPNLLGAGAGSMLDAIIKAAGGHNALATYPDKMVRLNEEMLPALNPDMYIMQVGPMNKHPVPPAGRPHFQPLRAIATGNTLSVDEDTFSRPGPRSIDAVEALADLVTQWAKGTLSPETLPRQILSLSPSQ